MLFMKRILFFATSVLLSSLSSAQQGDDSGKGLKVIEKNMNDADIFMLQLRGIIQSRNDYIVTLRDDQGKDSTVKWSIGTDTAFREFTITEVGSESVTFRLNTATSCQNSFEAGVRCLGPDVAILGYPGRTPSIGGALLPENLPGLIDTPEASSVMSKADEQRILDSLGDPSSTESAAPQPGPSFEELVTESLRSGQPPEGMKFIYTAEGTSLAPE